MTTKRTSGLKLDAELTKDERYVENTLERLISIGKYVISPNMTNYF